MAAVLATAALVALAGCAGGAQAGLSDEHPTPTTAPNAQPAPAITPVPHTALPLGHLAIRSEPAHRLEKLPPGSFAKRAR
ncbi:hypothetical protein GCM10022287_20650 [Gryllotalpicola koreensis]|uniref:Uncharacterized protein n=2 Tax=Gryllotalpicola koreensis TaxID=993086 RepID=A0ABP8A128_9MICO